MSWSASTLNMDSENNTENIKYFQTQIRLAIPLIEAIQLPIQSEQWN